MTASTEADGAPVSITGAPSRREGTVMAWWEIYVAEHPFGSLWILERGPWFTPHQRRAVGGDLAWRWQCRVAEAYGAAWLESCRIEGSHVRPLLVTSSAAIARWQRRNSWFARHLLLEDASRRIARRVVLDCVNDRWTVDIQPRWLMRDPRREPRPLRQ